MFDACPTVDGKGKEEKLAKEMEGKRERRTYRERVDS